MLETSVMIAGQVNSSRGLRRPLLRGEGVVGCETWGLLSVDSKETVACERCRWRFQRTIATGDASLMRRNRLGEAKVGQLLATLGWWRWVVGGGRTPKGAWCPDVPPAPNVTQLS